MKTFYSAIIMLAFILSACQQKPQTASVVVVEETFGKNEVIDAILARRSIRSYKPEQIKDEELDLIIKCAINAPSAGNAQPWEIRVVQDAELIKKIGKGSNEMFYAAPTLIVIAGSTSHGYSPVDCGLLGENVLLAAQSLNIGTCVIAGPIDFLRSPEGKPVLQALNIPDTHTPMFTIAMGYKNESPDAKPRDASKVQIIK